MPTPVPRPSMTLLPAESLEKVLSAGLWGTALRPLVACTALRRARRRSISSSISASITSEGRKSVVGCERSSVECRAEEAGEAGALFDDAWACGDAGREYGDAYCAKLRFGDGGREMPCFSKEGIKGA